MYSLFFTIVIFACAGSFGEAAIQKSKMFEVPHLANFWPTNGHIGQFIVPTVITCGMRCNATANCVSFFYDYDTKRCELHPVLYNTTTGLTQVAGAIKYYMNTGFWCKMAPPVSHYQTVILEDGTVVTFRIGFENVTQIDAQNICLSEGGRLLRILTEVKMIAFGTILTTCTGYETEFWTDGSNFNAQNKNDPYQWTTSLGEPLPYTPVFWADTTPVNPQTQNCLCIYGGTLYSNKWWNYSCDTWLSYYICEK